MRETVFQPVCRWPGFPVWYACVIIGVYVYIVTFFLIFCVSVVATHGVLHVSVQVVKSSLGTCLVFVHYHDVEYTRTYHDVEYQVYLVRCL